MEKSPEQNTNSLLYCIICLADSNDPVVTPCGHIFCWECIKSWFGSSQSCPTCKNGVNLDDIISLHSGSNSSKDKPKHKRKEVVKTGFFNQLSGGFFGPSNQGDRALTENEVKINQLSLLTLIIGIIIIYFIIYS